VADEELAAVEAGAAHYLESSWRTIRCLLRLPRGNRSGAIQDSERALDAARQVGDAQVLQPALALHARVLVELGQTEQALPLLDELLGGLEERIGLRSWYWWHAGEAAFDVGRRDDFLSIADATVGGPWVEAARAAAISDFETAIAVFADIGARPLEAAARRRAAEALLAAGRRADAEEQLELALAFWRSVGGTAYLSDGEALLAAAS
jgi:tetratricopeptide (TPR) repeat protein